MYGGPSRLASDAQDWPPSLDVSENIFPPGGGWRRKLPPAPVNPDSAQEFDNFVKIIMMEKH